MHITFISPIDTQTNADLAAKKVKVTYKDIKPPITDLRQAVEKKSFFPQANLDKTFGNPEEAMDKANTIITGEALGGAQYHMHMETQVHECRHPNGLLVLKCCISILT